MKKIKQPNQCFGGWVCQKTFSDGFNDQSDWSYQEVELKETGAESEHSRQKVKPGVRLEWVD